MNKKIFSLLAAGVITTSMLSGVVANAATGTKDVDVTYNNQKVITDPDNPNGPQWQVAIPSGINFTDDKKEVDASIELQDVDGSEYSGSAIKVNVSVESENGYKLKKGVSSEVGYDLAYDKVMDKQAATAEQITQLTETNKSKKGLATLSDDVASELGKHTDKLTYTVEKTN